MDGRSPPEWPAPGAGAFPSTIWSEFLQAGHPSPDVRRASLDGLARRYWKPICAYIRRWREEEDAKDLTQEFFIWMMETGFLGVADPSRGRFRGFVKSALKHFLASDRRRQGSQKRGGDRTILSLDLSKEEVGDLPQAKGLTPEEALDATWKEETLSRATARLQKLYASEGKEIYFQLFQEYHGGGGEADYRTLAGRHGLNVAQVSNLLQHAKERLRRVLYDLVSESAATEEDALEELRFMLGRP